MPETESILKVLCVDDNRDTADSLAVLMQIAGFEAIACYDGETALAAAAEFHPDVCVLDLNMPGIKGDELGRRVRAEQGNENTTLVALTGLPEDVARERTRAAGFDLHLTKPVDPERLANTVIDIVILRTPSRSTPAIPWPAARTTA
ncbi:histidine kinase : Multi-sensor hybrid histidine kinase OS=Hydrogenophaga sp. PBC GN=Q5W_0587 PE=4 SV=1: Response_reg [Gemmataceae bacterium]|nr:histidine kinase : Multi-sensor hybrid histidine kinase OS=Hydrogenophaga sp. PBC GN=Q5W_0587 PE=4 SV=1: Response_reg [Gemmataceae bacterium]VTU00745.1 histidine kinase : Multi-sensor hybrid histidine kinase OS=Hydrogenophaga sp. PBC GN=Q5W_0587 PE=4 SV=1: Response_reg [Gemmataceae bacterium]